MELKERLYYKMKMIRETEIAIENLFSEGKLRGTTHGSKGQEAVPVAIAEFIDARTDFICGGHRSHGHLLALSNDVKPLIAELMTKESGYVKGKGGSQHIRYYNFYCNGITGGMVPVATGMAFAQKKMNNRGIAVVFFGDGAMNEGYVMEAFNLASIYKLPVLFVLENNLFAMSTSVRDTTAVNFKERVLGFGIEYIYQEANDILKVYDLSKDLINRLRDGNGPLFVEFNTHRFSGHSKSDKREYISKELDAYWESNDPLQKLSRIIDNDSMQNINRKVREEIDRAVEEALKDPYPVS
jgi:acetoin:2,6-dichlorophenolindophenol oxidoreductase subunit alpha